MKHLLISLGLCFAMLTVANAQLTTEGGARSDQINMKIHEVDLLLQIMPLLLTKEQLANDILPAVEIARSIQKKQLKLEDEGLAKLEPILDDAIAAAYGKGAYPPRKITDEVASSTSALGMKRLVAQLNMASVLTAALEKSLNAGQMKALVNSFDPKFIDPSVKPESLTTEAKMNFFVKRVFMDPMTYEILKKLAAK